jgi:hypothetical protein
MRKQLPSSTCWLFRLPKNELMVLQVFSFLGKHSWLAPQPQENAWSLSQSNPLLKIIYFFILSIASGTSSFLLFLAAFDSENMNFIQVCKLYANSSFPVSQLLQGYFFPLR